MTMPPHPTPSLPSGEVGELIALLIRDAELLDSVHGKPITFESTEFPQRLRQAAAALTASEAERERMRLALKPFADAARDPFFEKAEDRDIFKTSQLRVHHLRAARAALDSTP